MTDNTPEGLPPLADLSEALARGREPRRMWTVLHAIEDATKSNLPQLLPVFGWGLIVAVLIGTLWAVSHGHHRGLRIALCGYENEHYMPSDWESISWSSVGTNPANAQKERIWFSPSCKPNRHDDLPLFKETT